MRDVQNGYAVYNFEEAARAVYVQQIEARVVRSTKFSSVRSRSDFISRASKFGEEGWFVGLPADDEQSAGANAEREKNSSRDSSALRARPLRSGM